LYFVEDSPRKVWKIFREQFALRYFAHYANDRVKFEREAKSRRL